jgi:hypothetical protein
MKKPIAFALAATFGAALTACGDDTVVAVPGDASSDHTVGFDGSITLDGGSDASPDGEAGPVYPSPPALGTQIDRMGRPAINTALNHTFDPACTTTNCPPKDAYNADRAPSHWSSYVPEFQKNLAIYDGLDTTCGNQAAFATPAGSGYTTLATVLAADALWLDTVSGTCQEYLGVELAALGSANTDCGGRTLTENVVDVTYNALAGTLGTATNVTNGITAPASAPSATFPYMAAPH